MSDLEQRLADALADGAEGAPTPSGLAAAARSRARTRRRNRLVGAAAFVALAVAVPTAVVATQGSDSDDPSRVATDPNADTTGVPDGYRIASWHSASIVVPDTWLDGGGSDWCASGGKLDPPRVARPGIVLSIGCTPQSTFGAAFQEIPNKDDFMWPIVRQTGDAWPEGAYVGARGIGGLLVTVAAPDSEVVAKVLDSMTSIGPEGDANGCTVRPDEPPPGLPDGSMAVCRYDGDGLLEQSELLTADDAQRAREAVEAAPPVPSTDACTNPQIIGSSHILLRADDFRVTVLVAGDCPTIRGLDEDRLTTPDVSYWALSPGWRGENNPTAVPKELRQN